MNTARKLVQDVEAAGGTIVAAGDKLRLSAPEPLPDSLMRELRQHKAEVMGLVGVDWDAETARIVEWFIAAPPPTEPFELFRGVNIIHPARWWRHLGAEISDGPDGSRAKYGSIQKDLKRLAELFGGPNPRSTAA